MQGGCSQLSLVISFKFILYIWTGGLYWDSQGEKSEGFGGRPNVREEAILWRCIGSIYIFPLEHIDRQDVYSVRSPMHPKTIRFCLKTTFI